MSAASQAPDQAVGAAWAAGSGRLGPWPSLPAQQPACLHPLAPQILTSRPRQEWMADVSSRYRALSQFSKDDARIQYLRIIRSLPYGNSIFFTVKVGWRGCCCWWPLCVWE